MSWDIEGFGPVQPQTRTPRVTVRCEYPDMSSPPSEVSFSLSRSYGLLTAREAHEWFLKMIAEIVLMTLMFVLPSDGSSQAVPSPGDRIRIKQMDGTLLTGTLDTWSEETIQLSVGSAVQRIRVERIDVLETSLGQRHRFRKYIAPSMLGGAVVGAVYFGITATGGSGFNATDVGIGAGFIIGGLIGLPVGFILGSVFTEERWNPVALPAPAAPRLRIRPVIGRGVGFAGSIRVGGL